MTDKITMDKKYTTRDGRPVRVLCVDAKDEVYPVIALIDRDGTEGCFSFTSSGQWDTDEEGDELDLIEEKPRIKRWLNVYPDHFGRVCHKTRKGADMVAGATRIACIEIDIEHGEGL